MDVEPSEELWDVAAMEKSEGIGSKVIRSGIFHTAVSAGLGATCTALVVTPLDVVKTRMQSHVCAHEGGLACTDSQHFRGMGDALRKIPQKEGIRALWRGLNVTLMLAVPSTALYFTFYDKLQRTFSNECGFDTQHSALFAGAAARAMTATVAGPLELTRTRMQSGSEGQNNAFQVMRQIVSQRGVKSLWSGLLPTLWRDAPFSAIYWYSYEALKARDGFLSRHVQSTLGVYLISGICAGSLAAAVTTPADVVKTRRQAVQLSMKSASSSVDTTLIRIGPRVGKVAPSCAIMMTSYEVIKRLFEKKTRSQPDLQPSANLSTHRQQSTWQ